jgi:uncharacterized membrane protein (Fun14 family)
VSFIKKIIETKTNTALLRRSHTPSQQVLLETTMSEKKDDDNNDNPNAPNSSTTLNLQSPYFISLAGQLGLGGVMGYSTGYAAKEIGKKVLFWGGTVVIGLQMLAYNGMVTLHWGTIFHSIQSRLKLDKDGDGELTGEDARLWFNKFTTVVSSGVPGNASFLGGLYLGLRS